MAQGAKMRVPAGEEGSVSTSHLDCGDRVVAFQPQRRGSLWRGGRRGCLRHPPRIRHPPRNEELRQSVWEEPGSKMRE